MAIINPPKNKINAEGLEKRRGSMLKFILACLTDVIIVAGRVNMANLGGTAGGWLEVDGKRERKRPRGHGGRICTSIWGESIARSV